MSGSLYLANWTDPAESAPNIRWAHEFFFGAGNLSAIMAGVTLAILPVLLVFLFFQRYLIEGITLTGLKG